MPFKCFASILRITDGIFCLTAQYRHFAASSEWKGRPRRRPRRPELRPETCNTFPQRKVSPAATKLLYLLNIFWAKAALPAPQELFVEALFAIDARVITTPDTTPGVDPAQSVAISGVIMECKSSVDGWSYRVRADDTRRNIIWVPEARVHRLEAAVFNFRKAQVASTHI